MFHPASMCQSVGDSTKFDSDGRTDIKSTGAMPLPELIKTHVTERYMDPDASKYPGGRFAWGLCLFKKISKPVSSVR